MGDTNLTNRTHIGEQVYIDEVTNLNIIGHSGRLGRRRFTVENISREGSETVFILKALGHDYGNREARVNSSGRINVRYYANGRAQGYTDTYYNNDCYSQGGKKKRKSIKKKTKRKSKKSRKSKKH